MAITLYPNGKIEGINNANFNSSLPSGHVIQTVVGTNGESGSSVTITSSTSTAPTFLNSNCKVTITPQRSNSKILLTWTAQIRLNPSSMAFFGVYYSANSNMSSPTIVEKVSGGSLDETYRTVNNSNYNNYMFEAWSRIAWDESISNTNVRYYNVGGYKSAGDCYYGDNGVALQLMAQEIAV